MKLLGHLLGGKRASANSVAGAKRSAGSLDSARSTARSTETGISGSLVRMLGTVSAACFARSACGPHARNGASVAGYTA